MDKRSADFHAEQMFEANDEPQTELGKKLQEEFEKVLEKIKDLVEKGKVVKENYIEKLKEIREQLKDLKLDLSKKAKEAIEKLKEKAKNYWNKILEKLKPEKRSLEMEFYADDNENPKTELGKRLRGHLDKFLEIVKDAIDHGKTVKESTIEKIKELRERLRELKEDIGQHAKELLQQIKEKAKDYFKKLWERLGFNKKDAELQAELFAEELEAEEGGGRFIQRLKERFNKLVEQIKDAMANGKSFDRPLEKLKELREKLKNISIGGKGKEFLEKLKGKIEDFFRTFKDKIGASSVAEADFNILDMFRKLKQLIKDKVDPEELKAKVEKIFGKGSELAEQFINALKEKGEKGKNKILEIIDRILGDKESKRSVKDVYEKLKNYFKDLNIELKENFSRFGEWVRDQYGKVLEKGKDRVETVKKIAREFLEDTRLISKDIAREARDFLKEYKDDLGRVYDDIREKVREILNRKE
ncbi:uncharacterized protein PF11_0207-like [Stegodyphus dumicola]|uniref:uncharacterized protein PF11_0207-like n=1 Tax=Stegodyphus dumicola TaxID=202533 RepID=UPI0015AE9952|nr:uncharacterized protein PF11_0207-like [Stegodyphus dumicola]